MEVNIKGNTRRNRKPIFALAAVLFLLAIGGTVAVYLEHVGFENKFQLAAEEIEHTEEFTSPQNWEPCDETPKTVVTTNNSDHAVKVRLSYDEWWRNQANTEDLPLEQNGRRLTTINFQNENDWELSGDWYYWKGELAPGESTRSLFKSVTFDCNANFAVQHICTNAGCTDVHSPYEGAEYHINITVQTTDEDFPREDEYFDVSINPNGGEFNGSSAVYTDSIQYGTYIDLSNISRTDHELVDWTLNGTTSFTDNRIRVTNNISLVANWRSNIFHTVTINPNGGTFDGSTEPSESQIRHGESFTLSDEAPTRNDYIFNHWDKKVGAGESAPITDYTFIVEDDTTITAAWDEVIAKNTTTNEVYPSISSAIAAANTGETVLLLKDTEEAVTIASDKDLTLDLGENVVTGSLVNDGTLTLLNGEINNPDGTAATNNGTLTLGINDYLDEERQHVNIQDDYVRLIGTTTGLDQNGTFNYYDGHIKGEVALEGGYNAAPSYRNTFDGVVVYYFPLVDFNSAENLQYVSLASSDNAVSKTTVGGDIYYYNLQDNINTSSRTGYKIYIVRDFDAGYAITSPADTNVTIDLAGYNVSINDTITINGTLNFEDSTTEIITTNNEEGVDGSKLMPSINGNVVITPHETTTATATYGGKISTPQTIINRGNLHINNTWVTGTTVNDTIQNTGTLAMEGGILGATTGYVVRPSEGATYDLDENAYILSSSANKAAIYNTNSSFELKNGNVYGSYRGIENTSSASAVLTNTTIASTKYAIYSDSTSNVLTIDSSTIKSSETGIDGSASTITNSTITANKYGISSGGPHTVTDSTITVSGGTNSYAIGIAGASVTLNNSIITVTGTGSDIRGIRSSNAGAVTMNGGKISVTANNSSSATGIDIMKTTMTNGTIEVTNNGSGKATGISSAASSYRGIITMNSGSISVNANTGNAYGTYTDSANYYYSTGNGVFNLNNGSVSVHSNKGKAYGATGARNSTYGPEINMTNGIITAVSDENSSYGIYGTKNTITGGKIVSGTYGIYTQSEELSYSTTIGTNDEETPNRENPEIIGGNYALYNGNVNFYDGILRGGNKAYQDGVIKAIPDATTYHIEESTEYKENCWLVEADNYLSVNNVEYNSLSKAYNAITGNSGTIKVIKSTTIEAILPSSPEGKEIYFDLNGHDLTYTQTLKNDGTIHILDSSNEQTGELHNPNEHASTITNNGNLYIESGKITSVSKTIDNSVGSSCFINGGIIYSTEIGVYGTSSSGENNKTNINISDGEIIIENGGTKSLYGIYADSNTSVNITGGQIKIERDSQDVSYGSASIYGIGGNGTTTIETNSSQDIIITRNKKGSATAASGTVKLKSGNIVAHSTNSYATGVSGTITMDDGNITVSSAGSYEAKAISPTGGTNTINGGTINVTSTGSGAASAINNSEYTAIINGGNIYVESIGTGDAYGTYDRYFGSTTFNNGTLTVISNNANAIGIYGNHGQRYSSHYSHHTYINGGTINVSAKGTSYGVQGGYESDSRSARVTITDGNISATSSSNTSIGVRAPQVNITGGKVEGGTYGIYTLGTTTTTIGTDGDSISTTTPEIIGGDYALYNGNVNFYDGILRGGIQAYQDGIIKAIADNATIHAETQTIDGVDYDTRYLVPEHDVAKIGDTKYTKLLDAIAAAETGDVIELLTDNYVFSTFTIPAEKDFTIETHNFNIITSYPITNNGKVRIINSEPSANSPVISYYGSDYFFTNNDGATLTLVDLLLSAKKVINNKGNLFTDNVRIDATDTAINNDSVNNNGVNTNLLINGNNYAVYNNSGEFIADTFTLNGKAYANGGKLNLKNGIINSISSVNTNLVTISQNGDVFLDNMQVNMNEEYYVSSSANSKYAYIINNAGTLAAEHSSINYNLQGKTNVNTYAVYNTNIANFLDSHISFNPTNLTANYSPYSARGIYNTSGNIGFESGSIYVPNKTAYGIYSETGNVYLGTPESQSSPDYGKATADVSTTNPDIRAIGTTTGIGVKNANGGMVYFYDGRITGSTAAMSENPVVEYMYEPKDYLDENNYHYRILEWMREQPGN